MAGKKPGTNASGEIVLFDVIYEDGTQLSNRRVPAGMLGGLDKERVLGAIKRGGTGSGRMPPGLLEGEDADAVATYVADVAGR